MPTLAVAGTALKAIEPTEDALRGADCVLIVTDHPEFDYGAVARHARIVVDTRHTVPLTVDRCGHVVRL